MVILIGPIIFGGVSCIPHIIAGISDIVRHVSMGVIITNTILAAQLGFPAVFGLWLPLTWKTLLLIVAGAGTLAP